MIGCRMEASFPRRELVSKVMGTAAMLGAAAANAEVDYAGGSRSRTLAPSARSRNRRHSGEVCGAGRGAIHGRPRPDRRRALSPTGVGFLGGSNIIDVNNANIRVYIKLQGIRCTAPFALRLLMCPLFLYVSVCQPVRWLRTGVVWVRGVANSCPRSVGMYPNAATKLVKFAPYKNAAEMCAPHLPGTSVSGGVCAGR